MRKRYYTLKGWLIALAAGLLGLNMGCEKMYGCPEPDMYGCPEADYEVKGRVTNQHGDPIPGIQARLGGDTVYTDAEGMYDTKTTASPWAASSIKLYVSDVDGPENGSYKDTIVDMPFQNADFEGGDGAWYMGRATMEQDVALEEK